MITVLKPTQLGALYDMAFTAYGQHLTTVIEQRLLAPKKYLIAFRMKPDAENDLIALTQKTWSKFLKHPVTAQEASVILASFQNLGNLVAEIRKESSNAKH